MGIRSIRIGVGFGALALAACASEVESSEESVSDASAALVTMKIEAEAYDPGGEGVGYHDTTKGNSGGESRTDDVDVELTSDSGGGYNVGSIVDGEWLQFTFTAPVDATYSFAGRVASGNSSARTFFLAVDGKAGKDVSFQGKGKDSYATIAAGSFALTKGKHVLRFTARSSGFKLNRFDVTYTETPTPQNCALTNKLVNPCRPLLGAWANEYSNVAGDSRSQIEDHERRIGRKVDIVHQYNPVGTRPLDATESYFAKRANTILLTNWKPTDTWRDADGRNATINSEIDTAAKSIKAIAPVRIMLAIAHEPENDVSGGTSCTGLKGTSGTPAEYRAMWKNVRKRFDAVGVTNVVWVMNFMGFEKWNCMVKDLWPGNDLVDWVMWDPYVQASPDSFTKSVGVFYDYMSKNSDATHDFASKAWGLAEWGAWSPKQAEVYAVYDQAKAAVEANTFPKLKALVIYDARESRVGINMSTLKADATEEQHYKAFAQSKAFVNP